MYHYTGCGLQNVWLSNGYSTRTTPYGKGVAISDVGGLHREIGRSLLHNPKRLTGAEFRFLRKEQELSQKRLGELFGVDAQAVARWEKAQTRVPKWADHFMRGLYNEFIDGDGKLRELIEGLNILEATDRDKLRFSRRGEAWQAKAA